MATFDFITDEKLKASLEADYGEALACTQAKAWKSVHVLVGSIVEAVLMDYISSTDYGSRMKTDPLKMDLGQLIEACQKEGVLSLKTVQLSSAVKSYRNLIHPGRTIRLNETVDENGATVARALLEIVVNEVSARKKQTYGYTADQIVRKIESDPTVMDILPHLLKDMREFERRRLLIDVLPNRYFELDTVDDDMFVDPRAMETQNRLSECFRHALALSSAETKKKATQEFVRVLKEEGEHKVLTYETAFFRAADLDYLELGDAAIVKRHLISRLSKSVNLPLVEALEGIEGFLASTEISELVDPLIRYAVSGKNDSVRQAARKYLVDLWSRLPGDVQGKDRLDAIYLRRLDDWISHFENQKRPEKAQMVKDIKDEACVLPDF